MGDKGLSPQRLSFGLNPSPAFALPVRPLPHQHTLGDQGLLEGRQRPQHQNQLSKEILPPSQRALQGQRWEEIPGTRQIRKELPAILPSCAAEHQELEKEGNPGLTFPPPGTSGPIKPAAAAQPRRAEPGIMER